MQPNLLANQRANNLNFSSPMEPSSKLRHAISSPVSLTHLSWTIFRSFANKCIALLQQMQISTNQAQNSCEIRGEHEPHKKAHKQMSSNVAQVFYNLVGAEYCLAIVDLILFLNIIIGSFKSNNTFLSFKQTFSLRC